MASLPPASIEGTRSTSTMAQSLHNNADRGLSPSIPNSKSTNTTGTSAVADSGSVAGKPSESSPLSQAAMHQHGHMTEEWDASQRGSSILDGPTMQRSNSATSQGEIALPSRGGTLKKKASLRRGNSLKRSGSRRSSRAGSVRSLALEPEGDEMRSAFYSPVPTTGNPTEILATRFSTWRKVLKDLITYFREVQNQYEQRSKNLLKVSNVINNTTTPPIFLSSGGINDALDILRDFHKQSIMESNKAKTIENDVILSLTGLRSDLQQKIKEIKNLSGDFKNSVEKEMEGTRRAVQNLGDALGQADIDSAQITGKQDPYLLRLATDRQLDRQIDEENYLHQAYLNLEHSGRELEAIVVGEIQKSYNAYAGILKREADEAYNAVESLRTGPIALPKDQEWGAFVEKDEHFVDPRIAVRDAQNIYYPGRDHELASEVRAGLLERKSKYLKSYTAGWYVLTPTHLHEFKSADKTQTPIMSLYLPEQKLGSHSTDGGSSNKFMLKGRQTGSLHRGHSWVFRAETHDTMMAWYEDIRSLTENSPQERSAFVRKHARSFSGTSQKAASVSSDGAMDEEDEEPFSAAASSVVAQGPKQDVLPKRPQPGGRFPSDLQVNAQRGLQAPLSPSSGSSSGDKDIKDHDAVAAASGLPGSGVGQHYESQPSYGIDVPTGIGAVEMTPSHASHLNRYAQEDGVNPYTATPIEGRHLFGVGHSENSGSGLGGAVDGAVGTQARYDHLAETAPEVNDYRNSSNNLRTPPTDAESEALLAAQESATIAAPDTDLISATVSREYGPTAATLGGDSAGHPEPTGIALAETQQVHTTSPAQLMANKTAIKQGEDIKRPTIADILRAGQRHESNASASQLHVPGEFPGGAGAGKGSSV